MDHLLEFRAQTRNRLPEGSTLTGHVEKCLQTKTDNPAGPPGSVPFTMWSQVLVQMALVWCLSSWPPREGSRCPGAWKHLSAASCLWWEGPHGHWTLGEPVPGRRMCVTRRGCWGTGWKPRGPGQTRPVSDPCGLLPEGTSPNSMVQSRPLSG